LAATHYAKNVPSRQEAVTAHYTHVGIQAAKGAVATLPDVTSPETKALPQPENASGAMLETILAMLEKLNAADFRAVADRVADLQSARP